jgi:hypothetical protein
VAATATRGGGSSRGDTDQGMADRSEGGGSGATAAGAGQGGQRGEGEGSSDGDGDDGGERLPCGWVVLGVSGTMCWGWGRGNKVPVLEWPTRGRSGSNPVCRASATAAATWCQSSPTRHHPTRPWPYGSGLMVLSGSLAVCV